MKIDQKPKNAWCIHFSVDSHELGTATHALTIVAL